VPEVLRARWLRWGPAQLLCCLPAQLVRDRLLPLGAAVQVQTVVCSTFTHEAKPATPRVADGERMKPAGRGPLEDAGDREPPRRCRYATLMLSSTSHLVLRGSVLGSVM